MLAAAATITLGLVALALVPAHRVGGWIVQGLLAVFVSRGLATLLGARREARVKLLRGLATPHHGTVENGTG